MRSCTPKLNCSFLYSKDGQNSKFKKVETPRKIMEPEYPWNMHFRNVFFPDSNEFCLHTHSRTQKADWRTSKKQYTLPTSLHGMGYNFPWPKCAEENLKQKQMINMGKTNIIRLGHLFYFFYIRVMITLFICSSRVLIILPLPPSICFRRHWTFLWPDLRRSRVFFFFEVE